MEGLQTIYDSLWKNSIQSFRANKFELDDNLNRIAQDNRRGVSLIGRLGNETLAKTMGFFCCCRLIEPDQHYYSLSDIHITILSIISCSNGFGMENFDKDAYADTIAKSIKAEGPIDILFKGITASPSCIMLQGFPKNDRLRLLRQQLRESFKSSKLEHSIDKRYTIETAHSTIIRFKKPIADNNLFIGCLEKYRDYDFGISKIDKVDFVYNDWYMTDSIVSKIKTFYL